MQLNLDAPEGRDNYIRSYGPGLFKINTEEHRGSLIVSVNTVIEWPPTSVADLTEGHIKCLLELDPEVVIIGTGSRANQNMTAFIRPLVEAGTGFELMDTASACRTYNVLVSESRKVVAGLLMIQPEA